MSSVNRACILGRLGQDPDVRTTNGGQQVATLSIATSEKFTDRDGNKQDRTEWHSVVCWGKLAELAGRYLSKGRQVFVEGKIQTRSWEQDGVKRYSTEIVARELTFVDSGKGESQPQSDGGGYGRQQREQVAGSYASPPATSAPVFDQHADDEIPF